MTNQQLVVDHIVKTLKEGENEVEICSLGIKGNHFIKFIPEEGTFLIQVPKTSFKTIQKEIDLRVALSGMLISSYKVLKEGVNVSTYNILEGEDFL